MMMETTVYSRHSESVVRDSLEKKNSLEVHNRSHTKSFQEEKTAKCVERDVMVENVSSTTEYSSKRTPEKQQEAKMYHSKEKRTLEVLCGLSKKLKEKKDTTSRQSFTESRHKSYESRKSSSGKEESVRREHSGLESVSRRKLALKDNTSKQYEREAKTVELEVSSSSLVLGAPKHAVPISQRLSYQSGDVRVSKTHRSVPEGSNKDKSKQKYLKEKDQTTRQEKYNRHDSASHHSKMDISISYEDMVERELRRIRKNMEKINKKTSELEEGSTSQLVHSEPRYKDEEGLRRGHEDLDTLTPFLPSSRCCTPPPRLPVEKYWSDADETEDESDIEKHLMHVNSVNIVLNYLKAHSEEYYRKGKEPDSPDNNDGKVQPRKKMKGRLPFMAKSDSEWNPSKGKFVRKLHKSNRGGKLHSKHLSKQQHAGPSGEEDEPLIIDYDYHSRSESSLGGLAGNVKQVIASLTMKLLSKSSLTHAEHEGGRPLSPSPDHYRSHSPPDSQQRSLYSPLRHEDGRNRHRHSRHEYGESYSPWHKRRSLTRESTSPFRHSDLLKNSRSHSPSRYRDESLRERELFSSSRYRYDSRRDRESLSPPKDRCNSPWAKESYPPSRYRNDSLRDRGSNSPSRYRGNSSRDRGSYSPSRYKGDSWRESSPSRNRHDSLRGRESYSPSRCRGDSWKDRMSHSPSRYRHDSMKGRTSRSPSRHRGDSWRERRLQEEGSLRRAKTPALGNTEFSSSSQRSPFQRSPEYYPLDAQFQEPHFSKGLRQNDQLRSPTFRDCSRSPLRLYSRRSDLDFKRQRSRSSEKDVSPRRYKSIKHDGNRSSLELSKRSQSPRNVGRLSRRDRSQSVTSNTGRQEEKKKNINNDYFFNPALENTNEEYQQSSGPYILQDQIQEGERHFTEGTNLNSNSLAFRDMLTHDSLNDRSYVHPDQIKYQSYDSNKRGNFTPKTQTQIITLGNTKIDQPKNCFRVSSTGLAYQQPSCVPDVHDKQLQRSTTEPNEPLATQENLPGPSGISSITSIRRKDMDDLPDWLNEDSDINCDLEDLNGPLSEVSSLIADHKAATADKTYLDAGSASVVPMEQKDSTTGNGREGTEKTSLGLNTAEVSTLLSLIEIAKEHSATGKNLATNLPSILEKICQSSTTNKNVSDLLGGMSGEKKLSANMSQVSGGMQDDTQDAGSSRSNTCSGNNKNYISSKSQRDDQGVAPLPNKEKNYLPKDKASESNTFKKLSEVKEGHKLQQSKSKFEVGEEYNRPQGGKELSDNISKSQQKKGNLQVEKVIDKHSRREETNMYSMKKGKGDGSQEKRDKIKEQSSKKKEDVKETPRKINPACRSNEKRDIIGSKKSEIEKTFANMQCVRINIEDVSKSGTRKPYKGGRATSLTSPKTPPNQVGERPLSLDNSYSKVDSESPEAKKIKYAQLASDKSPQEVHPLRRETIVLEHSVSICLACKHKLVPDEFTTISLSTGITTMRCRNCHTFTKMKAMLLTDITKEYDAQKSTSLKKNCDKISSEKGKLPGSVGCKVISKNKSSSRMSQEDESSKYKKSMEDRQESSNNTSTMDPSLLVYRWSSSRKTKKIHDIKLSDRSSDDEEHVTKKQRQRRPVKKRRRILSPSTSESSDN